MALVAVLGGRQLPCRRHCAAGGGEIERGISYNRALISAGLTTDTVGSILIVVSGENRSKAISIGSRAYLLVAATQVHKNTRLGALGYSGLFLLPFKGI